ncbi:methyl-accepting chemotaxis protein [Sphingomonas sp. BIUV-7]|uniref:Methyl-accepting chemotaxis protein n=1 Tax=Sphingomonas natans TaxID=3063330 RepID=A0ABT8YDI4_9SPHN|nr:methyl-accepting chemotaxis protein [Sphingomonas sp. BIUV-7]MDO6416431.1 methyl-accepting chemotaxis protein [Sphingomonas sp. BIUV-7]
MSIDLLPRTEPSVEEIDLSSLCEPGGADLKVATDAPLSAAIERFRARPQLRLVAIVDAADRPIGAILEQDIRAILYNPFGHSLLMNPGFARTAGSRRRDCPTAEAGTSLGDLLDLYARSGGGEGMILTEQGRFRGLLANHTLLRLAGEREARLSAADAARWQREARASARFLGDVDLIADDLYDAAAAIDAAADATGARVATFQRQSATVTSACQRTVDDMAGLADHGARLATTIQQLRDAAATARTRAGEAIALTEAGSRRGEALAVAAQSIDENLARIRSIAVQAHLLSVNAAIEAARLGERGSGFSVVARELRQFAGRTRDAVGTIGDQMSQIREIAGDIATSQAAVEQIARLIDGVSFSVEQAVAAEADSARLLADNVDRAQQASVAVQTGAAETERLVSTAAGQTEGLRARADDLGQDARRLRERVDAFLAELGAVR